MKHSDIDAVISRAEKAVQSGASISPADLMLLLEGFKAFFHVQERLQSNDLTLRRLRKLLGIIPSSEKSKHGKQTGRNPKKTRKKSKSTPHGKSSEEDFPDAEFVQRKHTVLKSGDICPECQSGKIYKYEPAQFIRITGQAPLKATIHVIEQLRCNT